MDTKTLTHARFDKVNDRAGKAFGFGHTVAGLEVAKHYLEDYAKVVEVMLPLLKPVELRKEVEALGFDKVALLALSGGIDAIADCEVHLSNYYATLGQGVDFERYSWTMHNWDSLQAEKLHGLAKRNRSNLKVRRKALRAFAKDAGFKCEMWDNRTRIKVGAWLHSVIISGPAFIDDGGFPDLSMEAQEVAIEIVRTTIEGNPARLPSKETIVPWGNSSRKTVDGYPLKFVRTHRKAGEKAVDAAFKDRSIYPTVEAVNHAEGVPFVINTPILDLVEWAYEKEVALKKFVPKRDLPIPEHGTWEEMTEDEQKAWKIDARDTKQENRGFKGQRITLALDLETAKWLGTDTFYLPMNLDYRGRLYSATGFHFQRGDHIRSMFKFANGKPLGTDGLYWLKVHVANCGDFDKVSKKPFEERVRWVDDNMDRIQSVAINPKDDIWWTTADKPFMFVAACMELTAAYVSVDLVTEKVEDFVSNLPISFDGSCSGLQHFAAATRDEKTAYHVNLTGRDKPGDIYQVVADAAKKRIDNETWGSADFEIAGRVLSQRAVKIDRKLFKRNVMTYCYSSPMFGMANQHYEDTMWPLQREVMAGKLKEHPFGDDAGRKASQYLGKVGFQSVVETVKRPAEAMDFLRKIAGTMAHEGKPVLWHTPIGFPVLMSCNALTVSELNLSLHDRGVKRRVNAHMATVTNDISKHKARNTIAPSFVHSLDACHLHMVVLACKDEGINDLALVHDSFGCLAADASNMRRILKEQFHALYSEHNVLADILREACEQLDTSWHKLPNVPQMGEYNIDDILDAEYAFA